MFNRQQYVNAYLYVQNKLQGQAGQEEIDGIVHDAEIKFYGADDVRPRYSDVIISDHKDAEGNAITFTCEEIKLAAEK